MKRTMIFLCLVVAVFCLTACTPEGPPLASVRGSVTLDGKPLVGKSVRYFPVGDTAGVGAGANTGEGGAYELLAVRPGAVRDVKGIPPGKYVVTVGEPMFPIDVPAAAAKGKEPAPAVGLPVSPTQSSIPAKYTRQETSPLKVEVSPDGGTYNLELTNNAN